MCAELTKNVVTLVHRLSNRTLADENIMLFYHPSHRQTVNLLGHLGNIPAGDWVEAISCHFESLFYLEERQQVFFEY